MPNQAFLHARADDRFWAARRLAALDTTMIRAAVRAGDFRDATSEAFLVRALAERRDAILRTYLTAINPVADPVLSADGVLSFSNAAVDADVARAPQAYHAVWSRFDNATGDTQFIGTSNGAFTRLLAPAGLPQVDGAFVRVALAASGSNHASWSDPVHAWFRLQGGEWQLVGFERTPEQD